MPNYYRLFFGYPYTIIITLFFAHKGFGKKHYPQNFYSIKMQLHSIYFAIAAIARLCKKNIKYCIIFPEKSLTLQACNLKTFN